MIRGSVDEEGGDGERIGGEIIMLRRGMCNVYTYVRYVGRCVENSRAVREERLHACNNALRNRVTECTRDY